MTWKALSVRAPWWWAILHAGKDIENRDWSTRFRGTVLLHASSWWNWDEICDDFEGIRIIRRRQGLAPTDTGVTGRILQQSGGCIVGKVDIVDCVNSSSSPWFFGKYGFVLANPVAFARPVPFKGALGLFEVPGAVVADVPELRAA